MGRATQRTQTSLTRAVTVHLARIGETRAWLAEQVGWAPQTMYRRLSGAAALTTDDVDAIAEALGMSALDLYRMAERERRAAS